MFGRPQWMTPAGRSRCYVQEICRRIGEEKIELGNACHGVKARGIKTPSPKQGTAAAAAASGTTEAKEEVETPAVVLVEEGTGSEESEEGSDGVKVKVKAKGSGAPQEDSGRWEVVDSKGKKRYFDEVRKRLQN